MKEPLPQATTVQAYEAIIKDVYPTLQALAQQYRESKGFPDFNEMQRKAAVKGRDPEAETVEAISSAVNSLAGDYTLCRLNLDYKDSRGGMLSTLAPPNENADLRDRLDRELRAGRLKANVQTYIGIIDEVTGSNALTNRARQIVDESIQKIARQK